VEELQGIGRDITDRWRAEETLRDKETSLREAYVRIRSLAHQLMLAQEAERTEIARDLHDDVSQQLAALGIGLSLIEARVDDEEFVREEVTRLRQVAIALAEKVRHVSHELHPGILQHSGLKDAIASHCEATASQHAFAVGFESRGDFDDVPDDVALCLYRATQQALRNVAMHANASRVSVSLVRLGGLLELTISDDGRGFDPSGSRAGSLGLLSIEERVHLVNGKFSVTSRVGGGSRLHISVPISWA
jgi:two-component system sensor histidine kinase UhpB